MGKALTCCTHTWRLVFVVLNILFTMVGLALIGIGIWLIATDATFSFITNSAIASPAALLIVAGVVTAVISVVGIIGAIGMWYCILVFVSRRKMVSDCIFTTSHLLSTLRSWP
jgi:hypothetical protein